MRLQSRSEKPSGKPFDSVQKEHVLLVAKAKWSLSPPGFDCGLQVDAVLAGVRGSDDLEVAAHERQAELIALGSALPTGV